MTATYLLLLSAGFSSGFAAALGAVWLDRRRERNRQFARIVSAIQGLPEIAPRIGWQDRILDRINRQDPS